MACPGHGVRAVLILVCLSALLAGSLGAQDVTIDFEHFPGPDGLLGTADDVPTPTTSTCYPPPCGEGPVALLTTQYSSVGITFLQGTLHYFPSFWPGHQHFISSTAPIATLSRPARTVSITSYSYWNATLTAYGASDDVLGTYVLTHPSPGAYPLLGTLTLSTTQPIARFSVLPDDPLQILNLDDLSYGSALGFFTLPQCRLVDTREAAGTFGGPALAAGADRVFPLYGRCGIPSTARAVSVNLTVTGPTGAGNLRLYPAGSPGPLASAVNYGARQTRASHTVATLNGLGELAVRCTQTAGTADFILDVNGYFE
jgi:hypothetical protein